jgi:hypothetical protein
LAPHVQVTQHDSNSGQPSWLFHAQLHFKTSCPHAQLNCCVLHEKQHYQGKSIEFVMSAIANTCNTSHVGFQDNNWFAMQSTQIRSPWPHGCTVHGDCTHDRVYSAVTAHVPHRIMMCALNSCTHLFGISPKLVTQQLPQLSSLVGYEQMTNWVSSLQLATAF